MKLSRNIITTLLEVILRGPQPQAVHGRCSVTSVVEPGGGQLLMGLNEGEYYTVE